MRSRRRPPRTRGAIPSAGPAVAGAGFGRFGGRGPGGPGFGRLGQAPPGPAVGGPAVGAPGVGGLLDAATPNAALLTLLTANAADYTWVAATVGANSAAGVQLATGDPVMPIGGFNGTDPSPTLAQFQAYVADGTIHYFIAGGGFGGGRGGGAASGSTNQISAWVAAHFTAATVGGTSVDDLTASTSSSGQAPSLTCDAPP